MKSIKFLFFMFLLLSLGSVSAQDKMEIGAKVCLQTPKFWNGSFLDISTGKDSRIRPAFGVYTKYHFSKVLFAEYDLDLSWEGGGFDKRRTDLAFLKNTFFVGVSTNIRKPNSFNFKLGYSYNVLLTAKMDDRYTNQKSDVYRYFKTSSTSFPFSIGYVRKINDYTVGLNTYFQLIASPLSSQEHMSFAQTLQRFELKVSKLINTKSNNI